MIIWNICLPKSLIWFDTVECRIGISLFNKECYLLFLFNVSFHSSCSINNLNHFDLFYTCQNQLLSHDWWYVSLHNNYEIIFIFLKCYIRFFTILCHVTVSFKKVCDKFYLTILYQSNSQCLIVHYTIQDCILIHYLFWNLTQTAFGIVKYTFWRFRNFDRNQIYLVVK